MPEDEDVTTELEQNPEDVDPSAEAPDASELVEDADITDQHEQLHPEDETYAQIRDRPEKTAPAPAKLQIHMAPPMNRSYGATLRIPIEAMSRGFRDKVQSLTDEDKTQKSLSRGGSAMYAPLDEAEVLAIPECGPMDLDEYDLSRPGTRYDLDSFVVRLVLDGEEWVGRPLIPGHDTL